MMKLAVANESPTVSQPFFYILRNSVDSLMTCETSIDKST